MESDVQPGSTPPPPIPPSPPPPLLPRAGLSTPLPPGGVPPRRSRFWMFTALALAFVLVLSLAANFSQMMRRVTAGLGGGALRHRQSGWQEALIEPAGSRHKIAVIDIAGIITGDVRDHHGNSMVTAIEEQLDQAGEDRAVKAVILRVDSPGGEVLASDDIARALEEFQKEYDKPVIASMGGLAASGGYYVSAPCRWIVANELTMTGSIGVILHGYNYRGLLTKVGVRPEVYKSGKFKDMLSGEKEETEVLPEERQMMQAMIDETFARFKAVVARGRRSAGEQNGGDGRSLAPGWEEIADGRILSGRQAYEAGLVDELGNFDTAVERAKALAGVGSANLIHYVQPFDFGNFFRLFGDSEARTVKLDLGLRVPQLQAGRLYFLAPMILR